MTISIPDSALDSVKPQRAGEEIDAAAIERFLRDQNVEIAAPIQIEQFPKGHSNLTYLLRSGDRELVLRRPPFGSKVKTAHDMGREYRVLSKLSTVWPKAPRPMAYCEDLAVIGAPFYVMERKRGLILRGTSLPPDVSLPGEEVRRIGESLADTLAELHAIDYRAAGLSELGKPDGYVRRQVEGWAKRYGDAKTDEIPSVEESAKWLLARIPTESGAALIHNDFKHDNVVLDPKEPSRVVAVLDWEMSTIGDPLMDLGTALGYWVEERDSDELKMIAFGPTMLAGSLTRRELAERYASRAGRRIDNLLFYYCFALFKTAVVAQQIYARYKQGLTHDERFAMMIIGVKILADRAVEAAGRGSIEP
jgi:aminoglycoside phosphotransferase (APT) family kinase protein